MTRAQGQRATGGTSALEATLGVRRKWRPVSAREIAEWAESLGGVVQVLKQANPEDGAALYAEFGLTLRYDPTRHQIKGERNSRVSPVVSEDGRARSRTTGH